MNRERMIGPLFALSSFVASALLFLVQPMCAKMVLPCLGGAPQVWTTSMLFFQAGLLAGYAYACLGQRMGIRKLGALHLSLMALGSVFVLGWKGLACSPDAVNSPALWLLTTLTSSIGFPYVLLASAAPLLQFCFANYARGRDPYSLYAASNAGSLLGLVGYPFLIERHLSLDRQTAVWSGGFIVFALLIALTGYLTSGRTDPLPKPSCEKGASERAGQKIIQWLFLAFVPGSLMLSVTSHLSANLSPAPVLWMVPLSLYLVTYILAFSSGLKRPSQAFWGRWMPAVVLVIMVVLLTEATEPLWLIISLHLLGLFWIGMLCHTELARSRPPVSDLTKFYLCIAGGGAIAGLFNAIVAPVVFDAVWEYPLMLALASLVRQRPSFSPRDLQASSRSAVVLDFLLPLALALVTWILTVLVHRMGIPPGPASVALIFGLPLIVCYTLLARPIRFALAVSALLLAGSFYHGVHGAADDRVRSFFGVHRVTRDRDNSYRLLIHGNTEHGRQSLDPRRQREPLAYYHHSGPVGDLFAISKSTSAQRRRVAVIGLGAGTLAAYAQLGEQWTFYEIDSAIVHIARDSGYFTYLSDASRRGVEIQIVLGDGRLQLAASSERYGLIILDAFGSDSIPLHLVTREALAIYRERLTPDGVLGFHYSSRYLDLRPILARLAASVQPPMTCLFREDLALSESEKREGKAPSKWAVMTQHPRTNALAINRHGSWAEVPAPFVAPLWTDSSANLLDALNMFAR